MVPLCAAAFIFGVFPQPVMEWINPFTQQFVELILDTGKQLTLNP
jgi:hypothetical protein